MRVALAPVFLSVPIILSVSATGILSVSATGILSVSATGEPSASWQQIPTLTLKLHVPQDSSSEDREEALKRWWNTYRRGSKGVELFEEQELFRVRGNPPGRPPSGPGVRLYAEFSRYREKSWASPRELDPVAFAQSIREQSSVVDEYIAIKLNAYAELLEVLDGARRIESDRVVDEIMDIAIECALATDLPSKKTASWSRAPLVEREATLALQRVPGALLMSSLERRSDMIEASRSGNAIPTLWAFLFGLVRKALELNEDSELRDRAAALSLLRFEGSGALIATGVLRSIVSEEKRYRLSEDALKTLFNRVDKTSDAGEVEFLSMILDVLEHQPQEAVLAFLAERLAAEKSIETELAQMLREALRNVAPFGPVQNEDPGAWRVWFESERESERFKQWVSAQWEERSEDSEENVRYDEPVRFYGIPIVGHSVVFVIDVSGSMGFPLRRGEAGPKIAYCREELSRAISALADSTEFNFITFDSQVRIWANKPINARKGRKKALEFIEDLRPGSATNLYGALVAAFGGGSSRRLTSASIFKLPDQIIVLSDGVPTEGDIIEGGEILAKVARMNVVGTTRIDTIAFGTDADSDFLRALADAHRGRMISYPKDMKKESAN